MVPVPLPSSISAQAGADGRIHQCAGHPQRAAAVPGAAGCRCAWVRAENATLQCRIGCTPQPPTPCCSPPGSVRVCSVLVLRCSLECVGRAVAPAGWASHLAGPRLLRCAGVTFVSVGHRPTLTQFHDSVLLLHGEGSAGSVPPALQAGKPPVQLVVLLKLLMLRQGDVLLLLMFRVTPACSP